MIDWLVVATISGPVVGAALGALATRVAERQPKLITYYGHVSAFRASTDNGRIDVNTHTVIVRNSGRRTAVNVRLGHILLPEFQVNPTVPYIVSDLPNNGKEIVIASLVPNEEITVSYLYFPPVIYNQINTYVKSDEGSAKVVRVLLQPRYPRWLNFSLATLIIVGAVTTIYVVVELTAHYLHVRI